MAKDSQSEADYIKELTANGVDLPELSSEENDKSEEPEDKAPEKEAEEPEGSDEESNDSKEDDKKSDESADLKVEPKVPRKRSIYDDLKDKKKAVRDLEQENQILREKLEGITQENTPEEKEIATDDAVAYAKSIGADDKLVELIIQNAAEKNKSNIDPDLARRLDKFEKFEKQNASIIEKQLFDEEFTGAIPKLKQVFPNASPEEIQAMKTELDNLSHTTDMADKDLEYVAFKNREKLGAFISPKKRGMEDKGRNQQEENSFEFDANPDFSKMSLAQREAWEKMYEGEIEKQKAVVTQGKRKLML